MDTAAIKQVHGAMKKDQRRRNVRIWKQQLSKANIQWLLYDSGKEEKTENVENK